LADILDHTPEMLWSCPLCSPSWRTRRGCRLPGFLAASGTRWSVWLRWVHFSSRSASS